MLHNLSSLSSLGVTPPTSQVSPLYAYTLGLSGLVAYYPLDEASGNAINRAPDTFGSLNGTVTGATQNQTGLVGKAYSFDGGDVLTVAHNNLLNVTDFTYNVFFKLNTLHENGSDRKELVKKDSPFIFDINNNGTVEFAVHNGSGYDAIFSTKASWAAGTWFMLTLVNDADVGRIMYVNGSSNKTGSGITTGTSSATMYLFADSGTPSSGFVGVAQHVSLCSSVLTPTQILTMAQLAGLA